MVCTSSYVFSSGIICPYPFIRLLEIYINRLYFLQKIIPHTYFSLEQFPLIPQQHFLQHIGVQVESVRLKRWHCWWLALTWYIWKLQNSIVFSNATFNANKLFEDATFLIWTWLRGFAKDFTIHFNQWSSSISQGFCISRG